jgi:hypothetical protein
MQRQLNGANSTATAPAGRPASSAAPTPAGCSGWAGAAVAGLLGLPLLQVAAGPLDLFLLVAVAGRVADYGRRLVTLNARLQVRLGKDDPVAVHFDEGCNAIWESWRHASPDPEETSTEQIERRKQMRAAWQALNTSLDVFLAAAVTRAGTVPMQDG